MYGMNSYGGSNGYNSSSSGYSNISAGYSGATGGYTGGNGYSGMTMTQPKYAMPETPHASQAETFLADNRPVTPIISELGEIKEVIHKTYEKITGEEFPEHDIMIKICDEQTFKLIHMTNTGHWKEGIMGFSYNKYGKGTSEIYIKTDHMDSLLLTIGHEIGHVLSPTLPNAHDEEAKAHAFSLAWMETIREHNIGGLQPNIKPNPAHNGLHDTSYDFVKYLLNTGASSYDIFKTLSHGLTSMVAR